MNQLGFLGYRDAHVLEQRADRTLWRAIRESDGCPVIIKASSSEPTPSLVQSLQHEYDVLQRLDVPSVVRAYAIIHAPGLVALVLEDLGGQSLDAAIGAGLEPGADSSIE